MYDGSYTMMAKPIRALELHYPMIQFLIKVNIHRGNLLTILPIYQYSPTYFDEFILKRANNHTFYAIFTYSLATGKVMVTGTSD